MEILTTDELNIAAHMGMPPQAMVAIKSRMRRVLQALSVSELAELRRQYEILKSQLENPAFQSKTLDCLIPDKRLIAFVILEKGTDELFEASLRGRGK